MANKPVRPMDGLSGHCPCALQSASNRIVIDFWTQTARHASHVRALRAEIAGKSAVPLLGRTVLTKLRPEQIAAAQAKALKWGRRDGAGGLKPRTVQPHARILKQAVVTAVRWRMLQRNPLDDVDPPKVERER